MSDLSYPVENMALVAQNIRAELDTTWQQHYLTIKSSTFDLSDLFPSNIAEIFNTHITTWHQHVQDCYNALYALADVLDKGGQLMSEEDQRIDRDLQEG